MRVVWQDECDHAACGYVLAERDHYLYFDDHLVVLHLDGRLMLPCGKIVNLNAVYGRFKWSFLVKAC